ncbi:hypothetical protein NKR23_g5541 [Pleurostoma richardsiae]|uniref:Uncharacterized protein n=1 Tax=Pleurostoma richardsiae TaxID=41990 RepID=A0AA38RFC0_9PEZI|nr:hypothetical protein NKR23_g5541 [Pleurostoma richardsiae]
MLSMPTSSFAFLAATILFAGFATSHVAYLDHGSHDSLTNAWVFPDDFDTRFLMINFDCPSAASYMKVTVNSTSLTVGVGIPNITTITDYRPSLWVLAKNLTVPDSYQTDAVREQTGIGGPDPFRPVVPRGFNAVEYPTEGTSRINPFAEDGGEISGFNLLGVRVNLTSPGDVYLVLQPRENRRGRAYVAVGTNETAAAQPGSASDTEMRAWFSETATPRLGERCIPWSA